MRPEDLPIHTVPARLGAEQPIEERILVELPADFYSLEEIETLARVMRKYRDVCALLAAPAAGTCQ